MAPAASGATKPREVEGLAPSERQALALLALAGGAAVAPAQLARLAEVEDAAGALGALERRGLAVGDAEGRFTIPPVLLERLRRGWDLAEPGEALLLRVVALARARLLSVDDLGAVVGVTAWAAESGRWSSVLRVVRAVATGTAAFARPAAWIGLLGYGVEGARALGDGDAHVWMLEQLAAAAAATGDVASAEQLLHRAARLRRDVRLAAQGARVRRALLRVVDPPRGAPRVAAGAVLLAALAAGGLALGVALFDEDTATGAAATFTIVQTTVGERTVTTTTTVERRRTVTERPRRRVVLRTITEQAAGGPAVETFVSTQTVQITTTVVVPTTVRVPTTVVVTTTVVAPTTVAPSATPPP